MTTIPTSVFGWNIVVSVAVLWIALGAAFDRFTQRRHKTKLHLVLTKWWIRLAETRIPDYPVLLGTWIANAFDRLTHQRRWKALVVYSLAAFASISIASPFAITDDDKRMVTISFTIPPQFEVKPGFFDSIPLPHALTYLVIFACDVVVIATLISLLRWLRSKGVFAVLISGFLYATATVALAVLCFAGALHASNIAMNHNMIGVRYQLNALKVGEPKTCEYYMQHYPLWITFFKTNTFPTTFSSNAFATKLVFNDKFSSALAQAPKVMQTLLAGNNEMWKFHVDVRIEDNTPARNLVVSYVRSEGYVLTPASLLYAGTVFYPTIIFGLLLLAMYVSRLLLLATRIMAMYVFERTTEDTGEKFLPGTMLGVAFGVVAAIAKCVIEILAAIR